jgi:Flp pilus assembly protein TadB
MNRIWSHVTLATIEAKRRLAGYLMSEPRLHWFSIAAGIVAFILSHWIVQLLLMIAAIIQAGAWLSATRLPK